MIQWLCWEFGATAWEIVEAPTAHISDFNSNMAYGPQTLLRGIESLSSPHVRPRLVQVQLEGRSAPDAAKSGWLVLMYAILGSDLYIGGSFFVSVFVIGALLFAVCIRHLIFTKSCQIMAGLRTFLLRCKPGHPS